MNEKEGLRLAEHIIKNAFGDLVGSVASALLTHGRLSVPELVHHTKLRKHSVHGILLVLIQHNLCWYTKMSVAASIPRDYFEMNERECLMRLRWGRILDATQEEFGDDGMTVVELILTHGKLSIDDILQKMDVDEEPRRTQISRLTLNLLLTSHILPTAPNLQLAPFDAIDEERKRLEAEAGNKMASDRDKATQKVDAMDKVRKARADLREKENAIITIGGAGAKSEERDARGKKRKRGEVLEIQRVNPDSQLRINYDVYGIKLRNKLLEQAAVERWNKPAGSVVRAFLKATADGQTNVRQIMTDIVSVHSIAAHMTEDEKDSLSYGFGGKVIASRSKIPELLSAYSAILAGEDNKAHSMGATSEGIFLERKEIGGGLTGGATYTVQIERICARMKLKLLEGFIEELHGPEAVRVFRVVGWGVKVLEMTVHQHTMLPKESIQTILARLLSGGFISLQQIPRGNDRTPNRSLFMYYVDLPRSYASLLSAYYKTIANLLHRRETELSHHAALLERANRSDVLNKQTLLSERDERDMEELNQKLDKLELAEMRTEIAVFILRDLPGDPVGSTFNDPYMV